MMQVWFLGLLVCLFPNTISSTNVREDINGDILVTTAAPVLIASGLQVDGTIIAQSMDLHANLLTLQADVSQIQSTLAAIRSCVGYPCMHGGTCAGNSTGAFACVCAIGFVGNQCQTALCTPSSCANGGVCIPSVTSYSCNCTQNYLGSHCQYPGCRFDSCMNGGVCNQVNESSLQCICASGFTGAQCETNINDCTVTSCQHSGTCLDGINSFSCSCPPNIYGAACELADCSSNPCTNGGTCSQTTTGAFLCLCVSGYTGPTCQVNIDDCARAPCRNGGTCIDDVDGYNCNCKSGIGGGTCNIWYNTKCGNPATAVGTNDGFLLLFNGYSSMHSSSCYSGGTDGFAKWVPTASGRATVVMKPDFWPSSLNIRSGSCSGTLITCLNSNGIWPVLTATFSVTAGSTYYIIADIQSWVGTDVYLQADLTFTIS